MGVKILLVFQSTNFNVKEHSEAGSILYFDIQRFRGRCGFYRAVKRCRTNAATCSRSFVQILF
jgi:hypothetical protein